MKKIKHFHSLSFKLTIWYILILAMIITLSGFFLYQGYKDKLTDELDKLLFEIADETYEAWRKKRGVSWQEAIQKIETKYSSFPLYIQVVELTEEKPLQIRNFIRSPRIPPGCLQLKPHLYRKADKTDLNDLIHLEVDDKRLCSFPLRTLLIPVRGPRILQVSLSTEERNKALNELILVMGGAGLLLLVLASAGGSLIISKALHPVSKVIKTAKKITADDLSLRIETKERSDEIGALVETFNEMIARLERSVKKIKQFSGDVSHELRTPLTIIRGEVEVSLRKDRKKEEYIQTMQSVLEEVGRMERIINDLLLLSRLEMMESSQLQENIDLSTIASEAISLRKEEASKKGLIIEADLPAPLFLTGHPELLMRLVINLLDNALRYTPSGGKIALEVKREGNNIKLQISDTGIGIPEKDLPFIFDRFYVVDPSRSKETGGVGLGLAIVKWIADFHQAQIQVESKLNQGTTFIISFPQQKNRNDEK